MNERIKKIRNSISIFLPFVSLLVLAAMFSQTPTGMAVYQKEANLSIRLQGQIPLGSHLVIEAGEDTINIPMIDFLRQRGSNYLVSENNMIVNSTYPLSMSLDNVQVVTVNVIFNDTILSSSRYTILK